MADAKDKLILIVEDDDSASEFLKFAIQKDGFRVITAADGLLAIDQVKKHNPDLIVLDMMLPKKSGFELIKTFQNEDHRHIPIFVVTGRFDDAALRNMVSFEHNVKELLTKPLKIQYLLSRIHKTLGTMSPEEQRALDRGAEIRKTMGDHIDM